MKKSPLKIGIIIGLSNFILAMFLFISADFVFPLLKFPKVLSTVFTFILFFVSLPFSIIQSVIFNLQLNICIVIFLYSIGLFLNSAIWGFIGWLYAKMKQ